MLESRNVAVLVYQAGRHIVDVYMWPANAGAGEILPVRQLEGFNLRHWKKMASRCGAFLT